MIEEPKGTSLAGEYVVIEAFDDKGRRLAPASSTYNRFVEDGEDCQEVWMLEKPADAQKVTVFAVDEFSRSGDSIVCLWYPMKVIGQSMLRIGEKAWRKNDWNIWIWQKGQES